MSNSIHAFNKPHLVLASNSPGELASWVQPIANTFKKQYPEGCVTVCMLPCQYATGNEAEVVRDLEAVDHAFTPSETLRFLFFCKRFPHKASKTAVISLGGDPFYAKLLAVRLRAPAYCYTEHRRKPGLFFKHIFYKHVDGDLMAAHVAQYKEHAAGIKELQAKYKLPNKPFLLMFTGSRPLHFEVFTPLCIQTIEVLLKKDPDLHIVVSVASTITDQALAVARQNFNHERVFFRRGNSLDFMRLSSCMLSLPGTNTAEAMYMQLPMLTVAPLNWPERALLDGLPGLIEHIPFVGMPLKRFLVSRYAKRVGYISLPNRRANREVVPQQIAFLEPEQLAEDIYMLYSDKERLQNLKLSLKEISGDDRVDELILEELFKHKS